MFRLLTDSIPLRCKNRLPISSGHANPAEGLFGNSALLFFLRKSENKRPFLIYVALEVLDDFFFNHSGERTDFCPQRCPRCESKADDGIVSGGCRVGWACGLASYHGLFYRHSGVETIAIHELCWKHKIFWWSLWRLPTDDLQVYK